MHEENKTQKDKEKINNNLIAVPKNKLIKIRKGESRMIGDYHVRFGNEELIKRLAS